MARKVAIYARVSTEHEAQISALENQVQYYDDILSRHADWTLVDRYIDEGITGTSIHKRESFMRMLKDAKEKKFDLIVTREVSRFARNTVDTLQQTRTLKTYGVEVWFTEDNIWTMNDEDGELRLSIMATLAQNESKKISQRVKAGQMISFKNGVLYGNGNILGYDRVGDKLVCTCGHAMNRRIAHKANDGTLSYIYQCYGQLRTGSPAGRLKKGLDIEGICDNSSFMEWKLEVQADFVFKKLLGNKDAIYKEAMAMAQDVAEVKAPERNDKERLEANNRQIEKLNRQLANLVDMCSEGDISREVFRSKKKKLEDQISNLEKLNDECRQRVLELEDNGAKDRRIDSLSEFIKMTAFDARAKIPDTVIDNFVDQIVFDHGAFIWYLNPVYGNEVYKQDASDWEKKQHLQSLSDKCTLQACPSTGIYCQCRKVEERKYFYFTTLIVTRDDVNEYMKYHAEYTKANRFKDIVCKIYI